MPRFDNLELDPPPDDADGLELRHAHEAHDEHYWSRLAAQERRQGHYDNALRYYSRALEIDKSLVGAWLGQVQMLTALEEYPEAELWARKALELYRNHGDLLAARAQALARLGRQSDALAICDTAMKQEGLSAFRWVVRGELVVMQGQDLDRHCFDKAVLAGDDPMIPVEIAAIYMHYRVPSKALARYRQALEKTPDIPFIWYRKALCEEALDLDDAARKSLTRCLELFPGYVDAAHKLAELNNRGWSLAQMFRRLQWWNS